MKYLKIILNHEKQNHVFCDFMYFCAKTIAQTIALSPKFNLYLILLAIIAMYAITTTQVRKKIHEIDFFFLRNNSILFSFFHHTTFENNSLIETILAFSHQPQDHINILILIYQTYILK